MSGWIKVHRELMDKPIWIDSTPEQKTILITLLMMANHTEKEWEWKGNKYKARPGQFVTSLEKIASKSGKGISIQNVRTAINRFKKYEFLTDESTNKNRLITIVNWGFYQSNEDDTNKQGNKQLTSNQQATNKQLTTNKNDKNDKNDKEKEYISQIKDLLSRYPDDIKNLISTYWNVVKGTRKGGRISYSVKAKTMQKWSEFDQVVVKFALKTHIDNYADERDEKYTLGIMRRTTPEEAQDRLNNVVTPFRKKRREFAAI